MAASSPAGTIPVAPGSAAASASGAPDAPALLRECCDLYRMKLLEMVRSSLELTGDLFEVNSHVPDVEIESFKSRRGDWLARFDRTLADRLAQRMSGERRRGRRPDADASLSSLRVLTPFDHDKQAALKAATEFLVRFTQRELAALDVRVDLLLPDASPRDIDNPFAVPYILDALGSSARAVYPDPRVWRPFMERLLADLTPGINKLYISLNRFLADRGVLPEIKAALRARSEFRPYDDKDLFPTFSKMLHEADRAAPTDIAVPALGDPDAPPALVFAEHRPPATSRADVLPPGMSTASILAGLAALAASGARATAASTGTAVGEPPPDDAAQGKDAAFFPSLDPLMALGTSSPLFATLAHWQRIDLPAALARATAPGADEAPDPPAVPRNLIPHIRAAIDNQISNDADRITMDVIALLFDYVFADRSIPDELRNLFGGLQVPIVKAALLDRTFFSDKQHPARQLLDHLADAAVGATHDESYLDAFTTLATDVVDTINRDFEIDVKVFRMADVRLVAFLESERLRVTNALTADVAVALDAESNEADRSAVRAFLRDRLAGIDVPFEVRGFVETVWADHLTALRQQHGAGSEAWNTGVRTLDDMLWSIEVKERAAQKARLTRMIPTLIGALRKGCTALKVAPERSGPFFESLYQLHMAAIKVAVTAAPAASALATATPGTAGESVTRPVAASAQSGTSGAPSTPAPDAAGTPAINVHDYVSEMAVGTWLAFDLRGTGVNARLSWVSPMRTKYLFTSRSRSRAFVYTPEELAYELGAGKAALVVEPVPLFDRAVSAALDTLAARQPAGSGPIAA